MIAEKIVFHPRKEQIEDTITLSYHERFIRRKG